MDQKNNLLKMKNSQLSHTVSNKWTDRNMDKYFILKRSFATKIGV